MTFKRIRRGSMILFLIFSLNIFSSAQSLYNENTYSSYNGNTGQLDLQLLQPDSNVLRFKVIVTNPRREKVDLSVRADDFYFLNSRMIKDPVYSLIYDFSEAEDGNYSIEVRAGKQKILKKISIRTEVQVNRLVTFTGQAKNEKLAF